MKMELLMYVLDYLYLTKCKKQILTGMYCDECNNKLVRDLNNMYAPKGVLKEDLDRKVERDSENKMRFFRGKK